jgi:hypothetical protein
MLPKSARLRLGNKGQGTSESWATLPFLLQSMKTVPPHIDFEGSVPGVL